MKEYETKDYKFTYCNAERQSLFKNNEIFLLDYVVTMKKKSDYKIH